MKLSEYTKALRSLIDELENDVSLKDENRDIFKERVSSKSTFPSSYEVNQYINDFEARYGEISAFQMYRWLKKRLGVTE